MSAPVIVTSPRRSLNVILANPRGFCAGVDRAIQIVERAIARYGAPVYVRHEIVHNNHVVDRLKKLGAVFVEDLSECPDDRPVVFSAHGVPKSVPAETERRQMFYIRRSTAPSVSFRPARSSWWRRWRTRWRWSRVILGSSPSSPRPRCRWTIPATSSRR